MKHKFMNLKTNKPFEVANTGKELIEAQKDWRKKYEYLGTVKETEEKPAADTEKVKAEFDHMRQENEAIIKQKRELKDKEAQLSALANDLEASRESLEAELKNFEAQKELFNQEKAAVEAEITNASKTSAEKPGEKSTKK